MQFSELVLQGVRRFDQMYRLELGSGFTLFCGAEGAGKSTIVDIITHLLFAQTDPGDTNAFAGTSGDVCRAALTMLDHTGQPYRLVKDLTRGSVVLTGQDAASGRFVPVSTLRADIIQYLGANLHVPSQDVFEGIFVTRASDLPSAKPQASSRRPDQILTAGVPKGGMGGRHDDKPVSGMRKKPTTGGGTVRPLPPRQMLSEDGASGSAASAYGDDAEDQEVLPDDAATLREQLAVLERDLTAAREADELQFEVDGLQKQMFDIDARLRGLKEISGKAATLEQDLQRYEKLSQLPENFEKVVKAFNGRTAKHKADLARLEDERATWEQRSIESEQPPLLKNRAFQLGLLIGIGALIVGVLGFIFYEPLRYLALLDLVGFGIAGVAAIRHIDFAANAQRSRKRLDLSDARRQKLDRQFELDTTVVRRALEKFDVQTPEALLDGVKQRNQVLTALRQVRDQEQAKRAELGVDQLEAKRTALAEKAKEIEGKLVGFGSTALHPKDMERRIKRIKDKLAQGESPRSTPSGASLSLGGQDDNYDYDATSASPPKKFLKGQADADESMNPVDAGPDACQTLLTLGQDLLLKDVEQLAAVLAPRCSQYVEILTDKAFSRVAIHPDGTLDCIEGSGSGSIPFATLPMSMQDLIYLSLKCTLIEVSSATQPMPVVLDDAFISISQRLYDVLGQILAGLGSTTQVILLTRSPELARYATASFSL
jgi:energy-coupling factor transporter ATP-binding protein EcfA2